MGILTKEGEELGQGVYFETFFGHFIGPFNIVFIKEGKDAHCGYVTGLGISVILYRLLRTQCPHNLCLRIQRNYLVLVQKVNINQLTSYNGRLFKQHGRVRL